MNRGNCLPRNVVRVRHAPGARVPERFGVKVKVFGKQIRVGSRFADVASAQLVARTFKQLVVKDVKHNVLLIDEAAARDKVHLTCRMYKSYYTSVEVVPVVQFLRGRSSAFNQARRKRRNAAGQRDNAVARKRRRVDNGKPRSVSAATVAAVKKRNAEYDATNLHLQLPDAAAVLAGLADNQIGRDATAAARDSPPLLLSSDDGKDDSKDSDGGSPRQNKVPQPAIGSVACVPRAWPSEDATPAAVTPPHIPTSPARGPAAEECLRRRVHELEIQLEMQKRLAAAEAEALRDQLSRRSAEVTALQSMLKQHELKVGLSGSHLSSIPTLASA